MTAGRIAWAIAIVAIVAFVAGFVVTPPTANAGAALYGAAALSFLLVGATLVSRVPGNRIGVLLQIAGILVVISAIAHGYRDGAMAQIPIWPAALLGDFLADDGLILAIVIALIGVPLIFPDGHLPSPRFRWIVWLTVTATIISDLTYALMTPIVGAQGLENPLVLTSLRPALDVVDALAALASIVAFGGAVAAVWLRYRRGTPVVRQQIKWLMAVAGVAAVAFPAAFLIPSFISVDGLDEAFFFIGVLALVALPWAVAIAVTRYRLYDLDRIVSRTIAYAGVTSILAVVFTGAILLLSSILSTFTQGQTVAVAASTLAVFALFQPIRRRVQRIVDRRFDRARYDGVQTATAFAERVRNETDMETVRKDLARTTTVTFAPVSLGIWLRNEAVTR